MSNLVSQLSANRLLNRLPRSDFGVVASYLKVCTLTKGAILYEQNQPISAAYFPLDAIISLSVWVGDETANVATVGRSDFLGGFVTPGMLYSDAAAVVCVSGEAAKVTVPSLLLLRSQNPAFDDLCHRSVRTQLATVQISAACNVSHNIEQRVSRWILENVYLAGSNQSIRATQETIAEALNVRRPSVVEVAASLKAHGLISYRRGDIEVTDKFALQQKACGCYHQLSEMKNRYLIGRGG